MPITTPDAAAAVPPPPRRREMKVLSLGLPRTGSYSMSLALTRLGYQDVYHGLQAVDTPEDWQFLGRAADGLFPSLPTYNGQGMTQDKWEEMFGRCEAVTDVAAPFAESLIQCYPDAKVVLVVRDFDKWYVSMLNIVKNIFGTIPNLMRDYIEPLNGVEAIGSIQRVMNGWAGLREGDDVQDEKKWRVVFDRHHEMIQRMVPPERLLVYKLGSGWEPLCEFLDKDVPEEPFPHGNEAAALRQVIFRKQMSQLRTALFNVAPYVVAAGAVGAGIWMKWYRGRA